MLAGSPHQLAPDLNQIPVPLIQRIELLTGGASAVYGSDAIAGVINFILNDHFEGVQGSVSYDFYNHQQHNERVTDLLRQRNFVVPGDKSMDGATTATSLTLGGNFAQDKGNAAVSERDYSACALSDAGPNAITCGVSNTGYPGRFIDVGSRPIREWTMDSATGNVRTYAIPGDRYNFAPLNYFQRPSELYGFSAFANYDFSANARLYAQFGFHDYSSLAQLAPNGLFGVETLVRYENPQLTSDWRSRLVFRNPDGSAGTGPGTVADVIIQRRNVEGGGRVDDTRLTSFREVLGLKGTVAQDWHYDVFFQTAQVSTHSLFTRDFSKERIRRALDVVVDPATGRAACASALNGTDPACVPYNPWSLTGVTPEALAYLQIAALDKASTSQQIMGGTMTTDLGRYGLRFPRARSGVEVAFGVERRSEKLDYEPDVVYQTGDLAGSLAPIGPVKGSIVVKDAFGEVRVSALDSLNVTGSYRHSNYGANKATDTYGVGFNAVPARFLRVRGSFQRAVREPDLNELFVPQVQSNFFVFPDPCSGDTPTASFEQCQRTGVTAAQYGQIVAAPLGNNTLEGGNPDLKAETARTYTFGVVLTPVRKLAVTVDYYDLRLEDLIAKVFALVSLEQCLATGDPRFCSLITRDPRFGTLWLPGALIVETRQNIGTLRTTGVEVAINYSLKLPEGHGLLIDAMGSYLVTLDIEPFAGATATRCAGYYLDICGTPNPRWRHRLRTTWQTPWKVDATATWRYIGSSLNKNPLAAVPEIKAMNYLDLAASWTVNKSLTLRGGVNNVLDTDPPLSVVNSNGNTFAQSYDVLGRHVFMSMTTRF